MLLIATIRLYINYELIKYSIVDTSKLSEITQTYTYPSSIPLVNITMILKNRVTSPRRLESDYLFTIMVLVLVRLMNVLGYKYMCSPMKVIFGVRVDTNMDRTA